ncbi:MAG: CDP-glycerol glycerophosphotransferase family protein [Oscillospiraceae bacterium]|jgi:hypothetical protein|nr:CDP-glycerol glycerophosphotransferase family protein [Oscillospiraceae bacterium]
MSDFLFQVFCKKKFLSDCLSISGYLIKFGNYNQTPFCDYKIALSQSRYTPVFGTERSFFGLLFCHYRVSIPYDEVLEMEVQNRVEAVCVNAVGDEIRRPLNYAFRHFRRGRFLSSKVKVFSAENIAVYFRQSIKNALYITVRGVNVTDSRKEDLKLNLARLLSIFFKQKKVIYLFEKENAKYEEGASIVFERLLAEGHKNVYFSIKKDSPQLRNIPAQYQNNVLECYSFKQYLYFFAAYSFISTEAMGHALELRCRNKHVMRHLSSNLRYVFLQHGVMYMLSLRGKYRSSFQKASFPGRGKVVVNSQAEAEHFVELGGFYNSDLYLSGLPKFDYAVRNAEHPRILIMPTWRPWDYNLIRFDPLRTSYFKFVFNIIDRVPDELKQYITLLPHPLLANGLQENPLKRYIPDEFSYDEMLRETDLLITDYSSISYDAFYRGSNVIFCWEEKDWCLEQYQNTLMLNEQNAFGDVSIRWSDLAALIKKNYATPQSQGHIKRYRKIVFFNDGKNTDRLIKLMKRDGYI